MNKYIILSVLAFLITIQLNAQPSVDKNWNTSSFFIDNFTPTRSSWDNVNWMDKPFDNKWKAHLSGCVTHGTYERMVYQKENSIFNTDGTIRLRAVYAGGLIDTSGYTVPSGMTKNPNDGPLYYKSGAICVGLSGYQKFLYGYFEIRCKLPVNRGAFPAFWLWDSSDNNYREIDVFEFSWSFPNSSPRYFQGQIYYYNGTKPANYLDYTFGRYGYTIPTAQPDLTNWHTYGVEWSPKRVIWYFDNIQVGSYYGNNVPSLSMNLVINNAVDSYATPDGVPISTGYPNEMTIDYFKVNKLKCACTTDATIQNNTQLRNCQ